jgi:hypothetical protein
LIAVAPLQLVVLLPMMLLVSNEMMFGRDHVDLDPCRHCRRLERRTHHLSPRAREAMNLAL